LISRARPSQPALVLNPAGYKHETRLLSASVSEKYFIMHMRTGSNPVATNGRLAQAVLVLCLRLTVRKSSS